MWLGFISHSVSLLRMDTNFLSQWILSNPIRSCDHRLGRPLLFILFVRHSPVPCFWILVSFTRCLVLWSLSYDKCCSYFPFFLTTDDSNGFGDDALRFLANRGRRFSSVTVHSTVFFHQCLLFLGWVPTPGGFSWARTPGSLRRSSNLLFGLFSVLWTDLACNK